MSRRKNRDQRAAPQRRAKRAETPLKTVSGTARTFPVSGGSEPPDPDALWASLRQGARNVAGVTFQVAVTADLLVAGRVRSPSFPRVSRLVPEGFEDVDCVLDDNRRLLVQAKERGPGGKPFGVADLADAMVHAFEALRTDGNELNDEARFVLVTDGNLGAGVPETGWDHSVMQVLADRGDDGKLQLLTLINSVTKRLIEKGHSPALVEPLIALVSVVNRPWHLGIETEQMMRVGLGLHASVANLAYARLATDLAYVAAEQRTRTRTEADFRSIGDLDVLINAVQEAVNLDALDQAIRDGVVELVDYTSPSSMSESEFLAGVDVTPAHVAAGLDAPRVDELSMILGGLGARGHVVIAGPSGSGKSALMWRAARDVGRGARPARVLRCSADAQVTLLVRHVRLQQPSPEAPLLVCVDDLGRDAFSHWSAARDQLVAIPGVLVLATVRREDFTAELAGDATVVDPRLTSGSAEAVYANLATSGIPLSMEPEEAAVRAEGLLMEFIALATTGRRLEHVLRAQVERLAEPHRRLQRRCLRLVTAAHILGSSLSADVLGSHLTSEEGTTADDISDALAVLADEHLLRPQADGSWRGLHDLRTEVLVQLLHAAPPPTLAATLGEALPLLPPGRQGFALRRAAEHLAVEAVAGLDPENPHEAVDRLNNLVLPIAASAGRILARLPPSAASPAQAADLLDGALRADAAIYAAACLLFLDVHRPPNVELQNLAFVTYGIRNGGSRLPEELPAGRQLNNLALQLPGRSNLLHKTVGEAIASGRLAEVTMACSLAEALALQEAAEGAVVLSTADAALIWAHHVAAFPDPPGDDFDEAEADRRARLAGTLAANASLLGPAVAEVLGPVALRAADAVATSPEGLSVSITFVEHDAEEDPDSSLVRRETFTEGQLLVAHARKLAQPHNMSTASADPPAPRENRDNSINDQAVQLARRLFDVCPEVDRVDVDILQANLQPMRFTGPYSVHEEGVKRLRRGVLPREPETRLNVAFQAAVARRVAAGSWSERLRQQATVASELVSLMSEALIYLRAYRNRQQLRSYIERAKRVATATASLPRRPIEPSR
jgi:hypothetical protein